jgi:hypothetical protein
MIRLVTGRYRRDMIAKVGPFGRKNIKAGIAELKHEIAGICGRNDEVFSMTACALSDHTCTQLSHRRETF